MKTQIPLALLTISLFLSCTKDQVPLSDNTVHYANSIKSIINNNCISCHDQTASIPLASKENIIVLIKSGQLLNSVESSIGQESPYLHMPPNISLPQVYIDTLLLWQKDSFPS